MVCVPCVIAPIVLLIWRYLIQPLLIRFWNFRKTLKANDDKTTQESPQLIKECNSNGCTFSWSRNEKSTKVD